MSFSQSSTIRCAVGCKQIIVNIDVPHTEFFAQIFHVLVNVGSGVVAETFFENGTVAVGALIHTAPRSNHRRPGRMDIAE